jgi:hypothetical protein
MIEPNACHAVYCVSHNDCILLGLDHEIINNFKLKILFIRINLSLEIKKKSELEVLISL